MIRNLVTLILSFSLFCGFSQQQQIITENPSGLIFHKDSLGNRISYEEAQKLLRSNEYVSVPKIGATLEIEHLIVHKSMADTSKYRTQTNGVMVMSTIGLSKSPGKFEMGDTLSFLMVSDKYGQRRSLQNDQSIEKESLIVFIDHAQWLLIKQNLVLLMSEYPDMNFIICVDDDSVLQDFFGDKECDKNENIYLSNQGRQFFRSSDKLPFYYFIDENCSINLIIPQLPNEYVAMIAIREYLRSRY